MDSYKYRQMCDAVSRKDFERAKQLVDDDERRSFTRSTFLIQACDERKKAIVDFLLKSGVAVDKTGSCEWTALMHAAVVGDDDIFELLLKHNADVMKKAWNGWTAFHVAAIFNNKNILNRLLMAVEHCNSSSLIRTASFVLTADGEDICGQTPLWLAAFHGHVDCVGVLLIHGANPDHKNKEGISPRDIAKRMGHTTVVNKLSESIRSSHFGLEKDRVISELKLKIYKLEKKIQKLKNTGQTSRQEIHELEILALREEVSKLRNELKMMQSKGDTKQAAHEVSLPLQTSTRQQFGRNATFQLVFRALCKMDPRATASEAFLSYLSDSLHRI